MTSRAFAFAAVMLLALFVSGAANSRPVAAGCPRAALPLAGTDPISAAIAATLKSVPASERPQIRGAVLALTDTSRGPQVRTQCGSRLRARTVVVYVLRRAHLPAQSASSGVYFVSRFASGYRVWQVAR